MVLGGLWHGASWNFVIWGALHGAALAATRLWQRSRPPSVSTPLGRALSTFLTFQYVCFAWVFFRAPDFAHAKLILLRVGTAGFGTTNLAPKVLALLGAALVVHFLPRRLVDSVRARFSQSPAIMQGVLLAVAALLLHLAAGAKAEPFVYGQF